MGDVMNEGRYLCNRCAVWGGAVAGWEERLRNSSEIVRGIIVRNRDGRKELKT